LIHTREAVYWLEGDMSGSQIGRLSRLQGV